jgi:uncharacterized protein YbjT (DUF2867 family)
MIGGTGLVGRKLARRLSTWEDVRLTSFVRRESATSYERYLDFEALLHGGGDLLGVDHIDVAISCLGTTMKAAGSKGAFRRVDYDYVYAFARVARRLGARQFILVSSVGASRRSSSYYLALKAQIESAVRRMGFERVDIIRPGLLLGQRSERRPAERAAAVIARVLRPVLNGRSGWYHAIEASMVAAAIDALAGQTRGGAYVHHDPDLEGLAELTFT